MPDLPPSSPTDITELLGKARVGDMQANERLADIVYPELRRIAKNLMRMERRDHTLQPTVLCNEAYMKLVADRDRTWENRTHFFACASTEMRRITVDYARYRRAEKRGGHRKRLNVDDLNLETPQMDLDSVVALDQALTRLSESDERQARIVEMRYFGGLTEEQIAEVLDISVRTVKRDWAIARDWLYAELSSPNS